MRLAYTDRALRAAAKSELGSRADALIDEKLGGAEGEAVKGFLNRVLDRSASPPARGTWPTPAWRRAHVRGARRKITSKSSTLALPPTEASTASTPYFSWNRMKTFCWTALSSTVEARSA